MIKYIINLIKKMTHKCDGLARFFDFIFAGGFAALATLYIIFWLPSKNHSNDIADYVLVGYYIFFALFMLGVVLRNERIILNFGFIDNVLLKTCFYVL